MGRKKKSLDILIKEFKEVHGNKYDYSKVVYLGALDPIKIICNHCNFEFNQTPNNHLYNKNGCSKCVGNQLKTLEEILIDFYNTHKDLYNYSKVSYINDRTDVTILCSEHGPFEQTPSNHKSGSGCPKCNESKGELQIRTYLEENSISFEQEKTFKDLPRKRFDFYIKELNLCIEYDGEFHYKEYNKFGSKPTLLKSQERDKLKNQYCKDNDINLLRIPYWDFKNIEKILVTKTRNKS